MTSTAVSDMDEPGSDKRSPSFAARPRVLSTFRPRYRVAGDAGNHAALAGLFACCESHGPGRLKGVASRRRLA